MFSDISTKSSVQKIVLAVFVVLMIPPFFIKELRPGLDESWQIALHLAWQNDLVFGKDFLFTYGPLGILYSRHALAVSKLTYIVFDIYFIITLIFFLREVFRKHFNVWLVILLFFGFYHNMYEGRELWCFFFFLYYLLEWLSDRSKTGHLIQALVLSLISLYIKVNYGFIAFILVACAFLYSLVAQKDSWRKLAWITVGYLLAVILSAYLLNVNITGYLIGSWNLIDGYNDAMFRPLADESIDFLILSLICVVILGAWFLFRFVSILRRKEFIANLDELAAYAITALFIFILFKSSFVRGHLFIFIKGISLPLLFLYLYNRNEAQRKLSMIVCYVVLAISIWGVNTLPGTYRPMVRLITLQVVPIKWNELKNYFSGIINYEESPKIHPAYQDEELKALIGKSSVDILPQEISKIYFNGLNYNPRPVIQSYSAYNEYLDNLNYKKYTSDTAPEFIIFSLTGIDDRFPFFDESKTKIALLSHYEVVRQVKSDIVFKRRVKPRKVQCLVNEETFTAKMNNEIPIKNTPAINYFKVELEYSLLGKLKRLFYQPPQCHFTFVLFNNTRRTFRAAKPVLEAGVLVNKYINNTQEFQMFALSQGQLDPPVEKIIIGGDTTEGGFKPTIKIRQVYYSFEDISEAEKSADRLAIENLLTSLQPKFVDFDMAASDSIQIWFDEANAVGQFVSIEGWSFQSNADNSNSQIIPVLRGTSGTYQLSAYSKERTDLNGAFNRKDLNRTGFVATSSLLPVGKYQLGIAIRNLKSKKVNVRFTDQHLFIMGNFEVEKTTIDRSIVRPGEIECWIDNVNESSNRIIVDGWAFLKGDQEQNVETNVILKNKGSYYRIGAAAISRPDIASHFKNPNLQNSGFFTSMEVDKLVAGSYTIGIEKINEKGLRSIRFTDTKLKVRVPEYYIPTTIDELPVAKEFIVGIDKVIPEGEFLTISGWAIDEFKDVETNNIRVMLRNGSKNFVCETEPLSRPDVTTHFNNGYLLDDCGFSTKIYKAILPKGNYDIGIVIQKKDRTSYLRWIDKFEQK